MFEQTRNSHSSVSLVSDPAQAMTEVLSKVRVAHCPTIFSVLDTLWDCYSHLENNQTDPFVASLRLLVVDSVASVLTPLLGLHPRGHALMSHISQILKQLATRFHIAVLITNNVRYDNTPALGEFWASVCNQRLFMETLSQQNPMTLAVPLSQTPVRFDVLKSTRNACGRNCTAMLCGMGVV
eukprot:c4861_g1_i1.p1 GENE.c4861_g1_i1~~c4861_g1_i1.p1  ORF type:complete len:182 (+),score=24.47 c4861_g1_i1:557-1102(+)